MTTTEAIGAETPDSTTDERTDFINGLRDLASFLEQNTDAPVPSWVIADHAFYYGTTPDQFLEAARAIEGTASIDGPRVKVTRMFGPVKYSIDIAAKDVCEERQIEKTAFVLPAELGGEEVEAR